MRSWVIRGVLPAIALVTYVGGLELRELAAGERQSWPIVAQVAVAPDLAPVLGALLGRQFAADLIWIRGLVYYGSTNEETADYSQISDFMDAVIQLDPGFHRVYRWAAYAMTFRREQPTQEEYLLSLKYLERGMKQFPDSYELFWLAGLRYYLDLTSKDREQQRRYRERGAELIEEAMQKPDADPSMASLAASLRTRLGQKERAIDDLRQMILLTDDPQMRERLVARMAGLTSEQVADEVDQAAGDFDVAHIRELPLTPPSLFVIIGPRPSPVIDFASLATERDLFGAERAEQER
jgi:hypothetical protein